MNLSVKTIGFAVSFKKIKLCMVEYFRTKKLMLWRVLKTNDYSSVELVVNVNDVTRHQNGRLLFYVASEICSTMYFVNKCE